MPIKEPPTIILPECDSLISSIVNSLSLDPDTISKSPLASPPIPNIP